MEIGRYQTLWRHTTSGRFVAESSLFYSYIHMYIIWNNTKVYKTVKPLSQLIYTYIFAGSLFFLILELFDAQTRAHKLQYINLSGKKNGKCLTCNHASKHLVYFSILNNDQSILLDKFLTRINVNCEYYYIKRLEEEIWIWKLV